MKMLTGIAAHPGKVTGKVYLVQDPGKIISAQKDTILVAPYTTPLMALAISNALAIVTDFGGVTSHAAIVAREFNKPCVVNTKNATKVLKNGQKITVDAEKGIIEYE